MSEVPPARDVNGHIIRELDDVAMLRPAVFSRRDGARVFTRILPKGAVATVISIGENEGPDGPVSILELESNEEVFFHFELPQHIAFCKAREEKLNGAWDD